MNIGDTYSKRITVTECMSASKAVDGVPDVFGTPSLLALIEATAHQAVKDEFGPGQTSVGLSVELRHTSPTPIGMDVECKVRLISREGSIINFDVEVFDALGCICTAKHSRAIVLMEKIVAKAEKKRITER